MSDPEFTFGDASLTVADDNSSLAYFYASEGMVTAPDKMITMPEVEINIEISSTLLSELQKAASVLGVNDLVLSSDGNTIKLEVTDKKNPTSNTFSRIVGEGNGSTYNMNFKIENLKVLDGNYRVAVSSKGISNFVNTDIELEYFIALISILITMLNLYTSVSIVPVSAMHTGVIQSHQSSRVNNTVDSWGVYNHESRISFCREV